MYPKICRFILFFSLPALFVGCADDLKDAPEVRLTRFEQDFFALDTSRLAEELPVFVERHPLLAPLFLGELIHDRTNPEETPLEAAHLFLTEPHLHALYDTVQLVYGRADWLERDLRRMFRQYRLYFPDRPIPEVATIISEFATDVFTYGDSLCGIGLDMFLGENFRGYDPEIYPEYIRRQFRQEYIVPRLARALVQHIVGDPPAGGRLIDYMIHHGKAMYIVGKLLPRTSQQLLMGYTREQMDGCLANERESWARLLDQNLLYSTDYRKFQKLISPSPNAPILFDEAPGEIGIWIGWRIVQAWAKRHPDADMRQLLEQRDSQKLLRASRYQPR